MWACGDPSFRPSDVVVAKEVSFSFAGDPFSGALAISCVLSDPIDIRLKCRDQLVAPVIEFCGVAHECVVEPLKPLGHCVVGRIAGNDRKQPLAQAFRFVYLPVADLGHNKIRAQAENDRIGRCNETGQPLLPRLAWRDVMLVEVCLKVACDQRIAQVLSKRTVLA